MQINNLGCYQKINVTKSGIYGLYIVQ